MFLIDIIERQQKVLSDLIDETTTLLENFDTMPSGSLVLRKRESGQINCYSQTSNNGKMTLVPLGKTDAKIVVYFKHRRYLQLKLQVLNADKTAVDRFLKLYKDYSPESIYEKLPKSYKDLPVNSYENNGPVNVPDKYKRLPEYIRNDPRFMELVRWASEKYKRNPTEMPPDPNISRDGTPMRSKGECMWYDDILFEGLPVRIEPEIKMRGKSGKWYTFYPDFVFKCFDGTYIYVEHFGMLDDEHYAERKLQRILEYLDCGIVLGDNLIVTSDNAEHHTNERVIVEVLELIMKRMFA